MPASNVSISSPLIRQKPWYPGQFGVPGSDSERGLRDHVTGAVFYVDPNAPGVSDQRDGTDPEEPLATISAAISKCQAYRGDQIRVMANGGWAYANALSGYNTTIQETVTLNVPGVSLIGVFPSSMPGVPWYPATALDTILTIAAIDCRVEGFAFCGGGGGADGIYAEWDGATLFADNVTIRNCLFDGNIATAIQLEYSWYCEIAHCVFEGCAYGVYIDPAGSGIEYCSIHHNWFQDCGTSALSLRGCEGSEIVHNRIYNATAQGAGVATDTMIDTTGGGDNIVAQNTLSCLLPVPANGDYDDTCTAAATDAWIQNLCMNGPTTTNPT